MVFRERRSLDVVWEPGSLLEYDRLTGTRDSTRTAYRWKRSTWRYIDNNAAKRQPVHRQLRFFPGPIIYRVQRFRIYGCFWIYRFFRLVWFHRQPRIFQQYNNQFLQQLGHPVRCERNVSLFSFSPLYSDRERSANCRPFFLFSWKGRIRRKEAADMISSLFDTISSISYELRRRWSV